MIKQENGNNDINIFNLKRNFLSGIGDGAFYTFAMGMVPLGTVLIYFISGFVEKKVIIGFLSFFATMFSLAPQIFIAKKLERFRRYKPFLIAAMVVQRVLWLLLGLDVILFAKSSPVLFVILFYVFYSLINLSSAFTNLTWISLIAKIIPGESRGRFLGLRASISGLFESAGALAMGIILNSAEYPYNYGILFITVFAVSALSLISMSFAKEQDGEVKERHKAEPGYLKRILAVYMNDKNYIYYLLTVIILLGPGKLIYAFQIVYAKEKIGIGISQVATATFILLICQTLGYFFWGFTCNKMGLKKVALISMVIFIPSIILTFVMQNALMLYLSIGLNGIAQSARNINEYNLMINLCRSESDRPLYVGIRNSALGILLAFNPLIAGFLYDNTSYTVLFVLSLIGVASSFYIMAAKVRVYNQV